MIVATRPPPRSQVPLTEEERERKLARAREYDAKLRQVAHRRRKATAELAYLLAGFDDEDLAGMLMFADVGVFAVEQGHVESETEAHDLIKVVRELERFPILRQTFCAGETYTSKVRRVLPHVTSENEAELAEAVRSLSNRKLEDKLREMKGLATPVKDEVSRTYVFSREGAAFVDQRVKAEMRAMRELGTTLTQSEALERILRGSLLESAASNKAPPWRVVVNACECGDKAWLQTRNGAVPVSAQTLKEATADALVADATGGPKDVTSTIPPATRALVYDRDQGRCRAPGCKNMGYLHVHHEPGRKVVGHDPDFMLLTCTRHHPDRHAGKIRIEGSHSKGFRFFLHDGTEILAPPPAPAGVPKLEEAVLEANLLLAKVAMKRLGLSRKKAAELVERARAALEARGEACSVDALVTEALRLMPSPDAVGVDSG